MLTYIGKIITIATLLITLSCSEPLPTAPYVESQGDFEIGTGIKITRRINTDPGCPRDNYSINCLKELPEQRGMLIQYEGTVEIGKQYTLIQSINSRGPGLHYQEGDFLIEISMSDDCINCFNSGQATIVFLQVDDKEGGIIGLKFTIRTGNDEATEGTLWGVITIENQLTGCPTLL